MAGSKSSKSADDEAANIPGQHKSAFMAFLGQLASFSGDLSTMTAPTFLLNGISMLEYSLHWCDYPELFQQMATGEEAANPVDPDSMDPAEQMRLVVRWFLSTLYGSFHERSQNGTEKKPYNPVLGECFFCRWESTDETAAPKVDCKMTVEQVSHHPPVSAHYVESPAVPSLSLTGYCGQKTRFKGMSVKVDQTGYMVLRIGTRVYTITYPDLVIRGLLSGNIFLELCNETQIHATTGCSAVIEYLPKPWFGGDYHFIKGEILDSTEKCIYKIDGRWTERMEIISKQDDKVVNVVDITELKKTQLPKLVRPVEEQHAFESRRLWKKCTDALVAFDYTAASREKSQIEERQRAKRRARQEKNIKWTPKFFEWHNAHETGSFLLSFTDKDKKKKMRHKLFEETGYWRWRGISDPQASLPKGMQDAGEEELDLQVVDDGKPSN